MTQIVVKEDLSDEEIDFMVEHIEQFDPEERAEILAAADALAERRHAAACYDDLIEFCKHMQPDYKVGKHHRILASLLGSLADTQTRRS